MQKQIQTQQKKSVDAFVIGGGPSGLAAAIALRRKGISVVVADAAQPAIDKACGEGLMPDALASLTQMGVHPPREMGAPFRGICFRDAHTSTSAAAYFPQGTGLGMRRTLLHQWLLEQAQNAGATLLWDTQVDLRDPDTLIADGTAWQAKWIVGADGQNSRVRQIAGLDHAARTQRFGFRQHFPIAPWNDCVEVYWAEGGQAYVTPIGASEICVALIVEDKHFRFAEIDRLFPMLAERLRGHLPSTHERGALTLCRSLPRVTRGNIALIGEASGSVDAITGEGLALSFQQALALAEAISSGNLSLYEARHRQISSVSTNMSSLLVFLGRHPHVQARVLRAFQKDASVFSQMLAVHLGAQSLLRISLSSLCQFGWNWVTA